MKKLNILFVAIIASTLFSCYDSYEDIEIPEPKNCDCEYVAYDKDETTNYQWREVYRSTWDASCGNELLDESVYTDSDGGKWYSKTHIECK